MLDEKVFYEIIKPQMEGFSGRIGMVIRSLDDDFSFAYQQDQVFSTASTAKVFILGTLLELCQNGCLSLEQTYSLRDADKVDGSGLLYFLSQGVQLTIRDVAMLMIIISDNTATNVLMDLVGGEPVITEHLQRQDIKRSRVNRKISNDPDIVAKCNFGDATAGEFALYLLKMKRKEILSIEYTAIFWDIMSKQQYKNLFPTAMPLKDYYEDDRNGKVEVQNKTGFMEGIRADVGSIRIADNREFVYALLANECRDISYAPSNEAAVLFANLGRAFYEFVNAE